MKFNNGETFIPLFYDPISIVIIKGLILTYEILCNKYRIDQVSQIEEFEYETEETMDIFLSFIGQLHTTAQVLFALHINNKQAGFYPEAILEADYYYEGCASHTDDFYHDIDNLRWSLKEIKDYDRIDFYRRSKACVNDYRELISSMEQTMKEVVDEFRFIINNVPTA